MLRRKAFNEMNLKHFPFKGKVMEEENEENLALGAKSGAIILQTEKFSFISKGLTPGRIHQPIYSLYVKLFSELETFPSSYCNE